MLQVANVKLAAVQEFAHVKKGKEMWPELRLPFL